MRIWDIGSGNIDTADDVGGRISVSSGSTFHYTSGYELVSQGTKCAYGWFQEIEAEVSSLSIRIHTLLHGVSLNFKLHENTKSTLANGVEAADPICRVPVVSGPSSDIVASSEVTGQEAWRAYSGSWANGWASTAQPSSEEPQWISRRFSTGAIFTRVRLYPRATTGTEAYPRDFKIQGSDNGNDWTDLGYYSNQNNCGPLGSSTKIYREYPFFNGSAFTHYRIFITAANDSAGYVQIGGIEWLNSVEGDVPGDEIASLGTLSGPIYAQTRRITFSPIQLKGGRWYWVVISGSSDWQTYRNNYFLHPYPIKTRVRWFINNGWGQFGPNTGWWIPIMVDTKTDHSPVVKYGRASSQHVIVLNKNGVKKKLTIPQEGIEVEVTFSSENDVRYVYAIEREGKLAIETSTNEPVMTYGVWTQPNGTGRYLGSIIPHSSSLLHPLKLQNAVCIANTHNCLPYYVHSTPLQEAYCYTVYRIYRVIDPGRLVTIASAHDTYESIGVRGGNFSSGSSIDVGVIVNGRFCPGTICQENVAYRYPTGNGYIMLQRGRNVLYPCVRFFYTFAGNTRAWAYEENSETEFYQGCAHMWLGVEAVINA